MYGIAAGMRKPTDEIIDNPGEAIHWALVALRALHRDDVTTATNVMKRLPDLTFDANHTNNTTLHTVLTNHLTDITNNFYKAEATNIEASDLPDDQKRRQLAVVRRRAECWSRVQRRLVLHSVLRDDGTPYPDTAASANALAEHWAPTFACTGIESDDAADELMRHILPIPPGVQFQITEDEFNEICDRTANSAPGPDGVPYAAWRAASRTVRHYLYLILLALLNGSACIPGFNHSKLVFIPKSASSSSSSSVDARPDELRPLNLSNTDSKIIAACFNVVLSRVACRSCYKNQFGFVQNRLMWDAILLLESFTLHLTKRHANAGMLFIDYKAAFPSVRHAWLRRVFAAMGFPGSFTDAFMQLYADNRAEVWVGGHTGVYLTILSGIRQGCPASGSVFALAIDPVIRMIVAALPPHHSITIAFADDLAIACANFLYHLTVILSICVVVRLATGMRLNFPKTVVIPLWTSDVDRAATEIANVHSSAHLFRVTSAFKHLGMLVGPGAHRNRWDAPVAKFLSRVAAIRSSRSSTHEAVAMYQPLAFSTLRFTARFVDPSPSALFAEARGVARIMAAPMHAMPVDLLGGLELLGGRAILPHLSAVAFASQLKAIAASRRFPEVLHLLDERIDDEDDEVVMGDPWRDWRRRSISSALCALWRMASGTHLYINLRTAPTTNITKAILNDFLRRSPTDILTDRIHHLLPNFPTELLQFFLRLRIEGLARARVPSTLLYSMLRTWCNALPTARRFGDTSPVCPLGCGARNGSDVRHLARCPALFLASLPIIGSAPIWPNRTGLEEMLLLRPYDSPALVITAAAMLDAACITFCTLRHGGSPNVETTKGVLKGRIVQLMRWSVAVRSSIGEIRTCPDLLSSLSVE